MGRYERAWENLQNRIDGEDYWSYEQVPKKAIIYKGQIEAEDPQHAKRLFIKKLEENGLYIYPDELTIAEVDKKLGLYNITAIYQSFPIIRLLSEYYFGARPFNQSLLQVEMMMRILGKYMNDVMITMKKTEEQQKHFLFEFIYYGCMNNLCLQMDEILKQFNLSDQNIDTFSLKIIQLKLDIANVCKVIAYEFKKMDLNSQYQFKSSSDDNSLAVNSLKMRIQNLLVDKEGQLICKLESPIEICFISNQEIMLYFADENYASLLQVYLFSDGMLDVHFWKGNFFNDESKKNEYQAALMIRGEFLIKLFIEKICGFKYLEIKKEFHTERDRLSSESSIKLTIQVISTSNKEAELGNKQNEQQLVGKAAEQDEQNHVNLSNENNSEVIIQSKQNNKLKKKKTKKNNSQLLSSGKNDQNNQQNLSSTAKMLKNLPVNTVNPEKITFVSQLGNFTNNNKPLNNANEQKSKPILKVKDIEIFWSKNIPKNETIGICVLQLLSWSVKPRERLNGNPEGALISKGKSEKNMLQMNIYIPEHFNFIQERYDVALALALTRKSILAESYAIEPIFEYNTYFNGLVIITGSDNIKIFIEDICGLHSDYTQAFRNNQRLDKRNVTRINLRYTG